MSSVPCMRSPCFSISAPIMYLGESRASSLNAQGECFSVVGRQFVFGAAAVAADLVAYAANRSNEGTVVSGINLPTQIVDVNVHDVRHGVKIEFPDLLDNGRAGNGLAFVAHQEFQQSEFLRAEINVVAAAAHGMTDAVDFEVFNLENRARGPRSPAQNSTNARGKFGEGKWFCDVIVRAGVKTADALLNHAGAGDDHDRQVWPFGANAAQDIQPASSRQIEIEEHEIVALL